MKFCLLIIALFLTACGGAATNQSSTANQSAPAASPAASDSPERTSVHPPGAPKQAPDTGLETQFAEIAKEAKGKVGVAAVVLETGENASLNGGEKFAMQSVYKVPISMAVMQQVDAGKFKPDQPIEITKEDFVSAGQRSPIRDQFPDGASLPLWHVIEYAIGESDGTASDVLLRLLGGPAEAQKYIDSIGVKDLAIKNTEKEFAKDWKVQFENSATPAAAVNLLTELYTGTSLDRERSKLILDFMNESRPGPNRIRGLLPQESYVAHKTGTSGTKEGITAATNDIGIIALPNGKYMAIAIFVGDSPADEKTRESVIAKIAKAAWDKWSK